MIRRMNQTASYIESCSGWDNALSKCTSFIINRPLVDKFPVVFVTVAYHPSTAMIVVAVAYLVFCILYFPLFLFSLAITWYGSFLLLFILICLGARSLARCMAYPGSTMTLHREYSAEYMRTVSVTLEQLSGYVSSYSATLLLVLGEKIPSKEIAPLAGKKFALSRVAETLTSLAASTDRAIEKLSRGSPALAPEDLDQLSKLRKRMHDLSSSTLLLSDCLKLAFANCRSGYVSFDLSLIPLSKFPVQASSSPSVSADMAVKDNLTTLCSKILAHTVELQKSVTAMRPQRSEESGGGDESGVMSAVSTLLKSNQPPTGLNRLAFPMMRDRLYTEQFAQEVNLFGADKNLIDVAYVPCLARRMELQRLASSQAATATAAPEPINFQAHHLTQDSVSPLGTVLFCCPNAGLLECLSQATPDSSWMGFYTSLGLDFCVFNYRGYGRSEGVPTPDRIKGDAEVVCKYLREVKRVNKIVIHGESIGGIAACHLARHCQVDLLVCDRTFASLDSLAARLLGGWAGLGLRYIGWWNTDLVSDYLAASCPKVIMQDPNDEIILDSASLKNGVAARRVLGDKLGAIRSLPYEYCVADALQSSVPPPPPPLSAEQLLTSAAITRLPLSEEFVVHLYACIWQVRKAAMRSAYNRTRSKTSLKSSDKRGKVIGSKHRKSIPEAGKVGGDAEASLDNRHSNGAVDVSPKDTSLLSTAVSSSTISSPGTPNSGDEDWEVLADEYPSSCDEYNSNDVETGIGHEALPSASGDDGKDGSSSGDWQQQQFAMSPLETLADYCSRSLTDPKWTPEEKAWQVLARVDGGTGLLLGHALTGGLDRLRSWLCASILWANRAPSDETLPRSRTSLSTCVNDLTLLMCSIHQEELGKSEHLKFIRSALDAVDKRAAEVSSGVSTSLVDSHSSAGSTTHSAYNSLSPTTVRNSPVLSGAEGTQTSGSSHSITSNPSVGADFTKAPDIHIGFVIPLHTKHGGWPKPADLAALKSVMVGVAGIDVKTSSIRV